MLGSFVVSGLRILTQDIDTEPKYAGPIQLEVRARTTFQRGTRWWDGGRRKKDAGLASGAAATEGRMRNGGVASAVAYHVPAYHIRFFECESER
jgi:hypothetical protein